MVFFIYFKIFKKKNCWPHYGSNDSTESNSLNKPFSLKTAQNILQVAGTLLEAVDLTFKNPLYSDSHKNLEYEKENFNDIFNSLPEDARKNVSFFIR